MHAGKCCNVLGLFRTNLEHEKTNQELKNEKKKSVSKPVTHV